MSEEGASEPVTESLVGWLQVGIGTTLVAGLPLAVLGTAFIASANPQLHLIFVVLLLVLVTLAVGLPLTLLVMGAYWAMGAWERWQARREARRWQDEAGEVVLRPDAFEGEEMAVDAP